MTFCRQASTKWHEEVPGSRWFRADLHTHTIDDLPGGRAKVPREIQGNPSEPAILRQYARVFLQGVARVGVQVLGLTPHSTKLSHDPESSSVWQIIDMWNAGIDDDGTPFRDKIYAIFPGFEPNVNDGAGGLHLIFLFDPEIGRDQYLSLFEAVMDGKMAWHDGALRMTSRKAEDLFRTIDSRQQERRESGHGSSWDYLVLAPHFQNRHGLLHEMKSQVLETFPCERLAAYELGDDKLPSDYSVQEKPGSFLLPFMRKHRQSFFHSSDAYKVSSGDDPAENEIGYRTTWVKLASPRIEALRQAFIASEARIRVAYDRDEGGSLRPISEPPDPLQGVRPWLRRVTVRGEAAFFGGRGGDGTRQVTVDLSPDLTCVIGGSMTGKSALLDGLRVHVESEMPSNERLRKDVEARGRERFLAGQPEVVLDIPGRVAGTLHERWPAVFFSQNELQRLAQDPGAVEDILARLVPEERDGILERAKRLASLDEALRAQAARVAQLLDERGEAEQRLAEAKQAVKALCAFEQAGLATMQSSEALHGRLDLAWELATEVLEPMSQVVGTLKSAELDSEIEAQVRECIGRMGKEWPPEGVAGSYKKAAGAVENAQEAVGSWVAELGELLNTVQGAVETDRKAVERKLAEQGHRAESLAEFQTLSRRAGMLTRYQAAFDEVETKLERRKAEFDEAQLERDELMGAQRKAFARVREVVGCQFEKRIRVRRIDFGISDDLGCFLLDLKQKGISQWWNALDTERHPSPQELFEALQASRLEDLGVSSTVAVRFREVFTEAMGYALRALRSPDRYVLELRVGDTEYREVDRLSGGKRVSLLLSLLLEAHDERPLVIDQPEDELDNRFLSETVLPALRRLKGRRQVIVATHNANIVVNGDADLVVQLEADEQHGRVAGSGAIEDYTVRTAIIETVDGGERAFELRKAKYGF